MPLMYTEGNSSDTKQEKFIEPVVGKVYTLAGKKVVVTGYNGGCVFYKLFALDNTEHKISSQYFVLNSFEVSHREAIDLLGLKVGDYVKYVNGKGYYNCVIIDDIVGGASYNDDVYISAGTFKFKYWKIEKADIPAEENTEKEARRGALMQPSLIEQMGKLLYEKDRLWMRYQIDSIKSQTRHKRLTINLNEK